MSRKDCFGSGADIGAPTVHSRFVRSAAVEINLALCLLMAQSRLPEPSPSESAFGCEADMR